LDINSFLSRQQGTVFLELRDGTAWNIPYDSLVAQLALDSLMIDIDTAYGGNASASMQIKGQLDARGQTQSLKIYQADFEYQGIPLTTGDDTLLIEIQEDGYQFKQATFYNGNGKLWLRGFIGYDRTMDLTLNFENLAVHPWLELYLPGREIQGSFSATSWLGGDFDNPELKLEGRIDSISYWGVNLGQLRTSLNYQDSSLVVDSMVLVKPNWYYHWAGHLPINLSFADTSSHRLLDLPQEMIFRGEGKSFGAIHLFLPDIEYLKGNFDSHIEISGTPLKPRLDGSLTLKDGEVKIDQLKDPLRKLDLELKMENDMIYFQRLTAELEGRSLEESKGFLGIIGDIITFKFLRSEEVPKGNLSVTGTIQVRGLNDFEYGLVIKGSNFPFVYEYMEVSGIAKFDLQIQGRTPPLVSGRVTLLQFDYEEPFGSPVTLALAGQKAADPTSLWDWELTIAAPGNVWIRNSDLNAELEGELEIYRLDGETIVLGILTAVPEKGRFFVAGRPFEIESGQIIFENLEKLDPTLDFLVSTRIYGLPDESSSPSSSIDGVRLRITGTISQPEISTPEGALYSQEEILEMLVLKSPVNGDERGTSPFQEKVLTSLGTSVGGQLIQSFAYGLGVETFYLRPAKGSGFDLGESEITVGGYITRGLYWQYSSKFSTTPDLALHYRVNRNLYLEGSRDRYNLYHLGLNLRWEF
jgi:autotransporter translocation and assembly factor TamB